MKAIFDKVSLKISKYITNSYSTSFSLGIRVFSKKYRNPIYAIYGFVRVADEIVDTFHDYDKSFLMKKFRKDTFQAIEMGISTNPVLNSFQQVVHEYKIDSEIVQSFERINPKVKLIKGKPLPKGWLGKNWACNQLSKIEMKNIFYLLMPM